MHCTLTLQCHPSHTTLYTTYEYTLHCIHKHTLSTRFSVIPCVCTCTTLWMHSSLVETGWHTLAALHLIHTSPLTNTVLAAFCVSSVIETVSTTLLETHVPLFQMLCLNRPFPSFMFYYFKWFAWIFPFQVEQNYTSFGNLHFVHLKNPQAAVSYSGPSSPLIFASETLLQ